MFYYDTAFSPLMKIVDTNQTSDGYSALIIKSVSHPTKEEIKNAKNKNFRKEYKKVISLMMIQNADITII